MLEMWAFTISCSQQDPPIEFDLHPEFMLQVPWDRTPQINVCDEKGGGCKKKDESNKVEMGGHQQRG